MNLRTVFNASLALVVALGIGFYVGQATLGPKAAPEKDFSFTYGNVANREAVVVNGFKNITSFTAEELGKTPDSVRLSFQVGMYGKEEQYNFKERPAVQLSGSDAVVFFPQYNSANGWQYYGNRKTHVTRNGLVLNINNPGDSPGTIVKVTLQ